MKDFNYIKATVFENNFVWDSVIFKTVNEYLFKRNELDLIISAFADELNEDDLEKSLSYKNYKGDAQSRNFGGLLLHLFNHQAHHRGMISIYLEMLGVENDFTNLLFLV